MIKISKDSITRLNQEVSHGVSFYLKGAAVDKIKSSLYDMPDAFQTETPKAISDFLGTPIMSNLIFGDPKLEKNYYIDISGNKLEYTPLTLDLAMLTVSSNKVIVKTNIQGRNGTIKEYVSDGDYQIDVKGIISDKNNIYPEEIVQQLINIIQIPSELPVISDFLQMFGINNVVIDPSSFQQVEGFRNQQEFTLTMYSDFVINLDDILSESEGQSVLSDSNIDYTTA